MSFSCFANSQISSVAIKGKIDSLDRVTAEVKSTIKKIDKLDKENNTLIHEISAFIKKLTKSKKIERSRDLNNIINNSQAVKTKNINEPVLEIDIPDGIDSIRGSFFYRLFHKKTYILTPYKLHNNEKIYFD